MMVYQLVTMVVSQTHVLISPIYTRVLARFQIQISEFGVKHYCAFETSLHNPHQDVGRIESAVR